MKEEDMYGRVGVSMNDSQMSQQKNESYDSKYTESWVPVKNISNGTIVLDNKQLVTGVKIKPRNIFILSPAAQDSTIISLKNFYNTIDFEFWLISADRPVDINSYLANLQVLYNRTTSPVIRKMIVQDINKANEFMDNNVTDTEFYILFKEKDSNLIQKRLRTLITGLANCGLEAVQTSNEDLRVLLDNFLNAGKKTSFGTVIG